MEGTSPRMTEIQRWYDQIPRLREVFLVLKNMNERERDMIASLFYQSVLDFRRGNRHDTHLKSVGRDKVLGYYKAYGKRRWYDKNRPLTNAAKLLSVMDKREIEQVIDEFISYLKDNGLEDLYAIRKMDLFKSI